MSKRQMLRFYKLNTWPALVAILLRVDKKVCLRSELELMQTGQFLLPLFWLEMLKCTVLQSIYSCLFFQPVEDEHTPMHPG